jgi:hypothetical protein
MNISIAAPMPSVCTIGLPSGCTRIVDADHTVAERVDTASILFGHAHHFADRAQGQQRGDIFDEIALPFSMTSLMISRTIFLMFSWMLAMRRGVNARLTKARY